MQRFATLLYHLALANTAQDKQSLLTDYLSTTSDPDRGFALALITGDIKLPKASAALIRKLATDKVDTELFELSRTFTKDPAETLSLLWPDPPTSSEAPSIPEIIITFEDTTKSTLPETTSQLMDRLTVDGRWAMLNLMKQNAFHGVTPYLAKKALSALKLDALPIIEEAWHPASPPYAQLFDWLEGRTSAPPLTHPARYRPMQQASAFSPNRPVTPATHSAEWLPEGLPVQLVAAKTATHLYTNMGDDISFALPKTLRSLPFECALDATLVVYEASGETHSNAQILSAISSKPAASKYWTESTTTLQAHDLLANGACDFRPLPFSDRRCALENLLSAPPPHLTLAQPIRFNDIATLDKLRKDPPHSRNKGIRIKSLNSPYTLSNPETPPIMEWLRPPDLIDAVLLYAKANTRKRGFDELTFGVWADDGTLVRIGKAPFTGPETDQDILIEFIKANTAERFGPVRTVTANKDTGLVLRIAFDGFAAAPRHKAEFQLSGAALNAIAIDIPPSQAGTLSALKALRNGTISTLRALF